jgi:hypothetical protein
MVNGEQSRCQGMIGLPFTVYYLPLYLTLCALRLALCVSGDDLCLAIRVKFCKL